MAGYSSDRAHRRRGPFVLVVLGVVVAAVGSLVLSRALPEGDEWPLLGGRLTELQATFAEVQQGAPPLIARTVPGQAVPGGGAVTESSEAYRFVGQGDDQGVFVAAPVLADWVGLTDVREGIKWIYIALFAVALAGYPLIFHRLTGSLRAALVAPLALLAGLLALDGGIVDGYSDVPGDLYWVLTWAPIALLPPLLILAREREWGRWGVPLLIVIALAAAFATTLRLNAGLPIVVAGALVVLLHRTWSWPQRGVVLAAFAAAYLVPVPAGMSAVREHSQDWAGERGGIQEQITTAHPFWHSVYIGSGYLPNDDLVIYRDEVGFMRAQERDPDVAYLSAEYERVERDLFLDRVRADPLAVAWQAVRKSTVVIRATAWLLFSAIVVLALAYLRRRGNGLLGWALAIAAPGVLLGMVTGLLVIPDAQYVLAWSGALLFLLIVGVSVLAADLARAPGLGRSSAATLRAELRRLRGRLRDSRPDRIVAALAGLAVFLTLAGSAAGARVYNSFQVWWTNSAGVADLAARTAAERTPAQIAAQSAVRFGVPGPVPALPKAVGLDGASGAILSDYDPFANGADLTVEGWARRASSDTEDALFGSTAAERPAFVRILPAGGDVQFFPANGEVSTWPAAWPEGDRWVHWAFVFDQGTSDAESDDARTARLYIDGELQGEVSQPQGYDDGYGNLIAGGYAWNHRDPFAGGLAGLAVYERALSGQEVAAHADAGRDYLRTVADAEPELLWKLDEAEGIEARDASGSGRNGLYAWDPGA